MTITTLPSAPLRTDTPTQFRIKADAFVAALPQFVQEVNATTTAYGVNKWISGTTYAIGDLAWSPANSQTYRRLTIGAGATDPASDATNWTQAYGSSVTQSPNNNSTANATTAYADLAAAMVVPQPNLLINPNWQFDQINEGGLYTINSSGGIYGPDGWTGAVVGSGVFKVRTLADPDNAALKCLEITCTTTDGAIAAGDLAILKTAIEGYESAALMPGTASAAPITIQFKFKTSVTGVYGIAVQNGAQNRSYVGIITVADTAEHEYSVTLTLDTAGTWLYTNGIGLSFYLCLMGGSTYQTTAGSWQAGQFFTTSAQVNFMSNVANIAYLKRVQLIPGSYLQTYKPADIQRELAKCQRYSCKNYSQGTAIGAASAYDHAVTTQADGNNAQWDATRYPVTMRAAAAPNVYNPATGTGAQVRRTYDGTAMAASVNRYSSGGILELGITGGAANTVYDYHYFCNARLS